MSKKRTEGPGVGWGQWRASRDKAIAKPKRSRYQIMMAKAAKDKAKNDSKHIDRVTVKA